MNYALHDDFFDRRPVEAADRSRLRELRPYQAGALAQLREAVKAGYRRIILQMPVGSGKTLTAAHIIHNALEKGKKPLFACPSINLVEQTVAALEREGVQDIGVIQAAHHRTDFEAAVQVASVQTMVRRRDWPADIVIWDEVHLRNQKLEERLLSPAWASKICIGLSATPFTRGLGLVWQKLIVAETIEGLIDEGYLCPFRVFAPPQDLDLSGVKTVAGDYHEGQLSDVMSQPGLVADAVRTWLERGDNQPTFMFAVNRAHAAKLQNDFREAGVSCSYIDGYSTPEERVEIFRRFRNGDDKIISSVGCLIEGVDEDARVMIDCAPTRSEARHIQKIGRVLRLAPGKTTAILLDHAGNCLRLGLPTDIRHDTLSMRRPGEKGDPEEIDRPAPKPRKCVACGCVMPPKAKACPSCGKPWVPVSRVESADGELIELGCDAPKKKKESAKDRVAALGKQVVFGMLEARRIDRGYKSGWSANQHREIFGVYPRSLDPTPIRPMAPELASWLRAKQIAFAKSRERMPADAR
jgi:superfamily II DNA or RNA helicase